MSRDRLAEDLRIRSELYSLIRMSQQLMVEYGTKCKNRNLFTDGEFSVMQNTFSSIIEAIHSLQTQQGSRPQTTAQAVLTRVKSTGRGRPFIEIDDSFLRAVSGSAPDTQVARQLGCSARTVRRRRLQLGLAEQGNPVFVSDEDGNRIRQADSRARVHLTPEDLDAHVSQSLRRFPNFGRRMLLSHIRVTNPAYFVSEIDIRRSIVRIEAAPRAFGSRRIQRRAYHSKGPMAMLHNDGQHSKFFLTVKIHTCSNSFS